jgi:hypothetical protein
MFGIVFELFIVEKQLLTRGEHKLCSAVTTLQQPVSKFHGRLPQKKECRLLGNQLERAPVPFPRLLKLPVRNKGPGPLL